MLTGGVLRTPHRRPYTAHTIPGSQVSRATLMEAITYAIVGVHVSTKKASLTVHPSWNLNVGESIEIGPLKFDDHVVK